MTKKENRQSKTKIDWSLSVLNCIAAAIGLLSSVGSADRVKEGALGVISGWYVGGVCWAVGTSIFVYEEWKIERIRKKEIRRGAVRQVEGGGGGEVFELV